MKLSEQATGPYHSGGDRGPLQEYLDVVEQNSIAQQERFHYDLNGDFIIALESELFQPAHQVTLRNSSDGWTADIHGEYWRGRWFFCLNPEHYRQRIQAKFFVDGRPMDSPPLIINATPDITELYRETAFAFPEVTPLYTLPYDNLDVSNTKMQQELVPGNRDESIVYDVIIIGAGMGGGVLADALSDANIKTLVLETGSLLFQTHIDNLPGHTFNFGASQEHGVSQYINEPGTSSNLVNTVQMNLGGRSVFWEGLIPQMDDWELNHWPTRVRQYLTTHAGYVEAEKLVRKRRTLGPFQEFLIGELAKELTDHEVSDLPRALHQPNLDSTASQVTNVTQRSTGVFSTADLLLDSLTTDPFVGRDYLTVNLNHLVTEIETKNGAAIRVVCQDLAGNVKRRYSGKIFVIAAGSLESPRIALASGLSDPYGKIGVGLTDHPAFDHPWAVELDPASPFAAADNHAKILIRHQDGAAHPYSAELVVNPRYWDVRHSDDEVLELATESTDKTFATMKFLFDSPLNDKNYITYRGSGHKLHVFVEPNLSGLPYRAEVEGLRNRVFSFLQATFDPNKKMDYLYNGSVHHAGGSLRMSSDHTGVVDDNLKFEAYDNLYCCDVSVFPRIPTANPCLTLVALAQRLAAHLKSSP